MNKQFNEKFLIELSKELREKIIKMINIAGSGHPGGSLSAIDVITYLYFYKMNIDPTNPNWPNRDRFILSKGHCAPAQYVALAKKGYFEEEVLWTLRELGSPLQGHPDMKKTTGVDMTTGSLGMGLSAGVGMALAGKLDKKDYQVYVMLGDGEVQSGQIWEAMFTAANYNLNNITVIIDNNKFQCDEAVEKICPLGDLKGKFEAFGWACYDIDGHDYNQIHEAFEQCKNYSDRPQAIIANTIKGKGVSFMEGNHIWHGKPTDSGQTNQAIKDIRGK